MWSRAGCNWQKSLQLVGCTSGMNSEPLFEKAGCQHILSSLAYFETKTRTGAALCEVSHHVVCNLYRFSKIVTDNLASTSSNPSSSSNLYRLRVDSRILTRTNGHMIFVNRSIHPTWTDDAVT